MKHLYAPWRGNYSKETEQEKLTPKECPFCITDSTPDEARLILKRYMHVFVMLNKYPYNAGHCLVVPYQHTGNLSELSHEARVELIEVTTQTNTILEKFCKADGTNIGINSGSKASGGSIPDHLHMHIVPRFIGDTTFLVTIADTKPISASLSALYTELKKEFITL